MAAPFLKWAGGKKRLASRIVSAIPPGTVTYHEPFLGGGAVFFAAQAMATRARLCDSNTELVECFGMVRDRTEDLIARLEPMAREYLAEDAEGRKRLYLERRAAIPRDPVGRSARLIFLNRTCYNGLYRVNARGLFNVPHGRYLNPRILDASGLRTAASALAATELVSEDFEAACAHAKAGDFVYLDPPYFPLTATARFTDYTVGAFGPAEHERLRDVFEDLACRGVAAMLSNSIAPYVENLYSGHGYGIARVTMSRAINSVGAGRAPVAELLIDNFERARAAPG